VLFFENSYKFLNKFPYNNSLIILNREDFFLLNGNGIFFRFPIFFCCIFSLFFCIFLKNLFLIYILFEIFAVCFYFLLFSTTLRAMNLF
jgi:hypothetical protein